MVCYGPSKGCKNCRVRKIKCDEGRPTCFQCAKSKRICPGYDRTEGVSFRDETRSTQKRSSRVSNSDAAESVQSGSSDSSSQSRQHSVSAKKGGSISREQGIVQSSSSSSATFQSPKSIKFKIFDLASAKARAKVHSFPIVKYVHPGLGQDAEQQSTCFFMTKFAGENRQEEIWGGCLEALHSLYNRTGSSSALSNATTATAMGSIAWLPGCAHFREGALSKYIKSLKNINSAVQDPKASKSDDVLMAVLMLGFYENIKSLTLQRSDKASHTRGAMALIKARDQQSFHKAPSLRLYLAVRANLLSQCIQDSDPKPLDDFLAATEGAIPQDYLLSCADRLVVLAMDIPRLRQREKVLSSESLPDLQHLEATQLLDDAKRVDTQLATWPSSLPDSFRYTSLPLTSTASPESKARDVYPHNLDMYSGNTAASTWNTWRKTRIQVLTIIMKCASLLDPIVSRNEILLDHLDAVASIQQLVNGICSSIPFHLGYHTKRVQECGLSHYPHPPGAAKWPKGFAESGATGGWLMMPALAFATQVDCAPQAQREWMLEYLTTFMRDPKDMEKGPVMSPKL